MDFNQIVLLEKVQNHNTIGVSSLITGLLIFLCMICIGRFLWVIHEKNIRERFLQKSMLACSIVGSILCCIIISAKTNFVNCISDTSFVEDNYVNPYECSFTQSESVKNLQNMLIIHVGEINLQNEVETYLGVPLHIGLFQDGVSVEQNVYQSLYGLTDILFEKYNYRIKAFSTFNPDSDIEVLSYLFESHNGDGSSLITDSTDEHTLGYIEKYIDQNSSALFFNSLYLKNYEELNLLLDWISKKNYYSQTCILLVDDIHETRKVINAKNNSANLNSVDEYEAFDLFPTIITWLGIDNPTHRLGLGYDLNSVSFIAGEQNLSSKYGKNALDKELCKKSKFLSRSYESDLSYLKANDNLLTRSFKFRINSDTTNKKIELVSNLYLDLDRYQGIDKIYAEVWQDGDKRQRQEFDLNSCPKRIVYQNFLLGGMLRNKKFYSNFSPDDWKKINQSDARVYELKAVFNDIDFDNDKINIHLYIKSDNGLIYPLYDVIEAEYRNYDNDLSHFLSDINYDDNILFISVKDDSSSRVSYLQRLILKGIGVDTDFKSLYRKGFCAVVNSGKVVEKDSYSVYLEGEVSYLDNNDGNKGEYSNIRYKMSSSGYDNGNVSSIIINNQEYSQNRKGMNIVVFDCKNGEVKESICFDTNGAIDYYHTNYCSK